MCVAASLLLVGTRTTSTDGRIAAQQFLMNSPELLARSIEVVLRCLKSLGWCRCGHPTTSNRLDHGQRFQGVGGIAQTLMGAVKPLALLLRELLWLAAYLHVAPSELGVPAVPNPDRQTLAQQPPNPSRTVRELGRSLRRGILTVEQWI